MLLDFHYWPGLRPSADGRFYGRLGAARLKAPVPIMLLDFRYWPGLRPSADGRFTTQAVLRDHRKSINQKRQPAEAGLCAVTLLILLRCSRLSLPAPAESESG